MPLVVCLLFGAIVATTDPSAVIAMFRDLGAPARLTRLVEGESLLNDATAIAVFGALLGVLLTGRQLDFLAVSERLVWLLAGGAFAGYVAGRLGVALLSFLRAYRGAQLTVTRSEEHTSELQSLMRISYAVFCLKKKTTP